MRGNQLVTGWLLPALIMAGGGVLTAQVFRSGVDLVSVNVVVTGDGDKFVSGLTAQDFEVFEDGMKQDVSFFAATSVPIDLALLLDTSASMTGKMETMQQAAAGFASHSRPGDRLMVVDIKEDMRVVHALDEDVAAAQLAIHHTTARGGTALYNGLYMTLKELVKQRNASGQVRRAAIVALSDGEDTSSLVSFEDVMEAAKQAGIGVYTITLSTPARLGELASGTRRSFSTSIYAMKAIAQETGGRSFFPADIKELAGVYDSIAEELASQYSLGYVSKNPRRDGSYRRIVVRVNAPDARTRTRAGYVAVPVAPPSAP